MTCSLLCSTEISNETWLFIVCETGRCKIQVKWTLLKLENKQGLALSTPNLEANDTPHRKLTWPPTRAQFCEASRCYSLVIESGVHHFLVVVPLLMPQCKSRWVRMLFLLFALCKTDLIFCVTITKLWQTNTWHLFTATQKRCIKFQSQLWPWP